MVKDQADAILEQAKLLLDDDVSVERRIRVARKIMEHARAIKVVCMAEPAYTLLPKSGPTTVTLPRKEHVWGRCWVDGVLVGDGVTLPPYTDWPAPVVTGHGVGNFPPIIPGT